MGDPINIGPFGNVTGRISALAYNTSNNTLYAGAAEGGLWKSTDGGQTWTALMDNQSSLAVGAIALDPANQQTVYVATGEANYYLDSYYSVGILKSTDGGQTWSSPLGQATFGGDRTSKGHHIGKIVVDPKQSQNVLVAADNGVWLSQDGGTSWARKLGNGGNDLTSAITDLTIDGSPAAASTVYAAWGYYDGNSANGVYKSTDGGLNFTKLANAPGGTDGSGLGRLALALAPSDPNRLYLLAANPAPGALHGASLGVWSSTDAGANWQQKTAAYTGSGSAGPDLLGDDLGGSPNTQRGVYSMVLSVDPTSPTTVYAGGINLFKSTDPDGGSNFSDITNVYVTPDSTPHPDQHALVFYGSASPRAFYVGTDGGVYGSTNAGTSWNNANGNLAITQFYAGSTVRNFATATGTNTKIWAGAQANGTQNYTGSTTWSETLGSTGGFTANDPDNPQITYAEQPNLTLFKTTDNGTTWNPATNGINSGDHALYIAPFVMDASNSNRLLAGTNYLYETTDGAANWHPVGTQSLAADSSQAFGAISAIAIAASQSNTVYAGTGDGKIWVSTNTNSGASATWTDITVGTVGTTGRFVTSLAVNPTDPQDVVVTFSGFSNDTATGTGTHVYRSTNGGTNWTDISGNLPDSPVNSVLRNPSSPATLYIGTDTGFYYTNNAGAASPVWTSYQTGLPNVAIDQIFTDRAFTTFLAATHGRSMFTLATTEVPTSNATLSVAPTSLNYAATVGGANPASQVATLTATGGNISWTTSGNIVYGPGASGWLSVNPTSGTLNSGTSTPITVNVNNTSLAAGTYTATVTFQDTGNAADKAVLNVTLVVSAAPQLSVNPTSLSFAATAGGANPASQVVTLSATGGNISWTTINNIVYGTGATGWLSVAPTNGTLNAGTNTPITVSVSSTGLATGTYTATVTFQDTANPADKATLNVTLVVSAAPQLSVTPNSVSFAATVGGANPASQVVSLTATGGNISWTTVSNIVYGTGASGWLALAPTNGTLNANTSIAVSLTATTGSLAAGTYTATVTFQDTANPADKAVLNVTFVVSAAPVLSVSPTSLNFTAIAGGTNPAQQSVNLSASTGSISWTQSTTYGTGATGWLTVAPTSGTTTSTPTAINVNATTGSLAAGTYTATITFQDTANVNDKAIVNVTFVVTAACNPLVVSSNTDDGAGTACGTLSYAINQANLSTVPVTVSFATSVISVTGTLPTITSTNAVTITIEGGCSTTLTNGLGTPGVRLVAGSGAGANALTLGNKTIIDGLAITGFSGYALDVVGSNNQITCNWLGTADGINAAANGGGIQIGRVGGVSADSNFIGLPSSSYTGNLISGNAGTAIQVNNGGYNEAHFNWINYQKDGTTLLSNGGPAVNTEIGGQIIFSDDNNVGY